MKHIETPEEITYFHHGEWKTIKPEDYETKVCVNDDEHGGGQG